MNCCGFLIMTFHISTRIGKPNVRKNISCHLSIELELIKNMIFDNPQFLS